MTLTHYIGGKITGNTADFDLPLSVNYPNLSTFINFETFKEYILIDGVWLQIGVGVPCILALFYDHQGDADNSFFSVASSGADGQKVALQINAGHAGIGQGLETVKLHTDRVGTVSGNYTIEHLAEDNTVKNSFTEPAINLPTSATTVTKTMTSGCQLIEAGDRIALAYTGTPVGTAFLTVRNGTPAQEANSKNQSFDGATWSDLSQAASGKWTVDGT